MATRCYLTERGKAEARIVVVKVGGSVLTGTKAFRRAALFLKHRCDLAPNEKFVVVVSARKRVTDWLEGQARRIVHTRVHEPSIYCGLPANCVQWPCLHSTSRL